MDVKELIQGAPRYLPARTLCQIFDLSPATFKVLLHRARRLGVPMPARKRLARRYYYETDKFASWIWRYADVLRGQFKMKENVESDDVENVQ